MPLNVVATTRRDSGYIAEGYSGGSGADVVAEDVLDMIVDVTPWETPIVTMLPKTQAKNYIHEWIEDYLGAPNPRHGILEGADFDSVTISSPTLRVRMKNYLQHFRREVKVTNLQREMNPFGIADEYAYQVGKETKGLGMDLETRILEDTFVSNTSNLKGLEETTAAGRMKNLMELIAQLSAGNAPSDDGLPYNTVSAGDKSNIRDASTLTPLRAASGIWDGTNPTISLQADITETAINLMMEVLHGKVVKGGGRPDTLVVSPAPFGHIGLLGPKAESPVIGALTVQIDAAMRKIIRAVKFYESQFGLLQVVESRWAPQATNTGSTTTFNRASNNGVAYFLERNKLRIAWGRAFRHVPLAPTGDSTRGMILGEAIFELLSAKTAGALVAVNSVIS